MDNNITVSQLKSIINTYEEKNGDTSNKYGSITNKLYKIKDYHLRCLLEELITCASLGYKDTELKCVEIKTYCNSKNESNKSINGLVDDDFSVKTENINSDDIAY